MGQFSTPAPRAPTNLSLSLSLLLSPPSHSLAHRVFSLPRGRSAIIPSLSTPSPLYSAPWNCCRKRMLGLPRGAWEKPAVGKSGWPLLTPLLARWRSLATPPPAPHRHRDPRRALSLAPTIYLFVRPSVRPSVGPFVPLTLTFILSLSLSLSIYIYIYIYRSLCRATTRTTTKLYG
jgi:hypothetical protein